jgi:hypothetical protein
MLMCVVTLRTPSIYLPWKGSSSLKYIYIIGKLHTHSKRLELTTSFSILQYKEIVPELKLIGNSLDIIDYRKLLRHELNTKLAS